MIIVGSQLIALPLTVPMSPLKRLSTSPFAYLLISSQSASTILSKISAWMSLLMAIPSFVEMRLMTLSNPRLNTVLPIMMQSSNGSFCIWYPVMISIRYFPATLPTSPSEVLKIPRIV